MDETKRIMRLEIGGEWTADDMIQSFSSLRDLYNLRLILQFEYEEIIDWQDFYREIGLFPPFRKRMQARFLRDRDPFSGCSPTQIPLVDSELSELAELFFPDEILKVRRVKYGSDGIKDLAGIGVIVGHVKDFVLDIIHIRVDKDKRRLENDERQLKNEGLRLENAQKFVDLAKNCGIKKSELRQIVHLADSRQEKLIELIDEGKITGVKLLNSNEENLDG